MLTPIQTITLQWLCSSVALVFVLARFWVRLFTLRGQHRPGLCISDALLVVGLSSAFGSSACDTMEYRMGMMKEFVHTTEELGKIRFAEKFLFDTGLYFPKMSLVLSYETMVPKTNPRLRAFLWCIGVYMVVGCVAATLADAFWCGRNPSVNWLDQQKCSAFTNPHLQKLTWVLNVVGELLLLVFPFSILKSLRFTQLRDKLNLAVIFTLGIITVIVSTVRFMYMIFLTNDISLAVWTTAETAISVIIVSTISLAPLLRRLGQNIPETMREVKEKLRRRRSPRKASGLPAHQRRFPSSGDDDLPMPKATAAWWRWPVDLNVNDMSVTTIADGTATDRTKASTQRSKRSTNAGNGSWDRSLWESRVGLTQMKEESSQMVSRGTQTLGRITVEFDPEGMPYGAGFESINLEDSEQ